MSIGVTNMHLHLTTGSVRSPSQSEGEKEVAPALLGGMVILRWKKIKIVGRIMFIERENTLSSRMNKNELREKINTRT